MTILITGATGLIGTALREHLENSGLSVLRATRNPKKLEDIRWDPANREFDLEPHLQIDGVVHLAGENLAKGRWTDSRKKKILESRRQGTNFLAQTIAKLDPAPSVLVSASGVNYYQSNLASEQDESAPAGNDFLSRVCQIWEEETKPAQDAGLRVVHIRAGVVLSAAGGALAKMLPAFRLGIAGRLGKGDQRMPWVSIDDAIEVIRLALIDERFSGPINVVAPEIVTNAEFTKTLAKTLGRPALLPVPAFVLKAVFGELADATLLCDLAVRPTKLRELGYTFRHPDLSPALHDLLRR